MKIKDIKEVIKYFKQYNSYENENYYFHKENDNFKISISSNNEVYQLNTDHENWGVEINNIDDLKIRFKSFTNEDLEDMSNRWNDDLVSLDIPKDCLEEVIHLLRYAMCEQRASNDVWSLIMPFCEEHSATKFEGREKDLMEYSIYNDNNK